MLFPPLRSIGFPGVVVTGLALTSYARKKAHLVPTAVVFESYGFSYTLFGLKALFGISSFYTFLNFVGLLLSLRSLIHLFRLKSIELFLLLIPLPIIHLTIQEKSFDYLGLLGTAFSISHDSFWIFRQKPCLVYRIMIQQIPCLILVKKAWFSSSPAVP